MLGRAYTQVLWPRSFAITIKRRKPTKNFVPNRFWISCLPETLGASSLPDPWGSDQWTLKIWVAITVSSATAQGQKSALLTSPGWNLLECSTL